VLALRAMAATGMSQREIAAALGISQPAVSQQLKTAPDLGRVHPEALLDAAAPVLKRLAEESGYGRLAAFGSVARGEARQDSDIDLLVESPEGTSSFGFIRFKQLLEQVLGRQIDLVDYGGLKPNLDDDIRREAVLL
jgi:predicted nucleotidyltransferase